MLEGGDGISLYSNLCASISFCNGVLEEMETE